MVHRWLLNNSTLALLEKRTIKIDSQIPRKKKIDSDNQIFREHHCKFSSGGLIIFFCLYMDGTDKV
jgi:hypothetical protein